MASRIFTQPKTLMSNIKVMAGTFYPNGTDAPFILLPPTITGGGRGFSVSRVGPGQFKITLQDDYPSLIAATAHMSLVSVVPRWAQIGATNVTKNGPNPRTVFLNLVGDYDLAAAEVTDITCPADTAAYASTDITVAGAATLTNGSFFVWHDKTDGLQYLFYYVIDNVNPTLSGTVADSIPLDRKIPVAIESTMTAPVVATVTAGTITSLFGSDVVASSSTAVITLLQTSFGVILPTASYDATSMPTAYITPVDTAPGVNSNLNNTYWLLYSAQDTRAYYVWYNVSGQGVDPAPTGKIGIEVVINAADNATAVATATYIAISAVPLDFTAISAVDVVTVTNVANGITTDASDGTTTGFTFNVTTTGDLITQDIEANQNNRFNFTLYLNNSTLDY